MMAYTSLEDDYVLASNSTSPKRSPRHTRSDNHKRANLGGSGLAYEYSSIGAHALHASSSMIGDIKSAFGSTAASVSRKLSDRIRRNRTPRTRHVPEVARPQPPVSTLEHGIGLNMPTSVHIAPAATAILSEISSAQNRFGFTRDFNLDLAAALVLDANISLHCGDPHLAAAARKLDEMTRAYHVQLNATLKTIVGRIVKLHAVPFADAASILHCTISNISQLISSEQPAMESRFDEPLMQHASGGCGAVQPVGDGPNVGAPVNRTSAISAPEPTTVMKSTATTIVPSLSLADESMSWSPTPTVILAPAAPTSDDTPAAPSTPTVPHTQKVSRIPKPHSKASALKSPSSVPLSPKNVSRLPAPKARTKGSENDSPSSGRKPVSASSSKIPKAASSSRRSSASSIPVPTLSSRRTSAGIPPVQTAISIGGTVKPRLFQRTYLEPVAETDEESISTDSGYGE